MKSGRLPPPPVRPRQRSWRVLETLGEHSFTGWITVDHAGALWCEATDGDRVVFGPGMWVRVESQREEQP